MASWPTYRTVILDQAAQEFVDKNSIPVNRFAEQWDGFIWLVSRSPHRGLPRDKAEPSKYLIYVVPENKLSDTQELWVLYSYHDGEVIIHAAKFASKPNE